MTKKSLPIIEVESVTVLENGDEKVVFRYDDALIDYLSNELKIPRKKLTKKKIEDILKQAVLETARNFKKE